MEVVARRRDAVVAVAVLHHNILVSIPATLAKVLLQGHLLLVVLLELLLNAIRFLVGQ